MTRFIFILPIIACASEPVYECVAVGTGQCPMDYCCPEGTYDVGDCYIETPKREYQCPDNGDATCSEAVCSAASECYGDETMENIPTCG